VTAVAPQADGDQGHPDRGDTMHPRPSVGSLLALVLCCLTGAGVGTVSAGWWTPWSGFSGREPSPSAGRLVDGPVAVGSFRKVIVPLPVWRPLRVTLIVRSPPGARRLSIDAPLDGARAAAVVETAPAPVAMQLTTRGARDGRVALYCAVEGVAGEGQGVVIDAVHAAPIVTVSAIVQHTGVGVVAGAALWAFTIGWPLVCRRCVFWRAAPSARPAAPLDPLGGSGGPERTAGPRGAARLLWSEGVVAAAAVAALLTAWAVIKPPFQAPDEPQHIMRATSMRLAPWVGGSQYFAVDNRHAVTLTWGVSPVLHGLIGRPDRYLTRAEVEGLKQHPHVVLPDGERILSAVASYPPIFYWYVFGVREVAQSLALTPWTTLHLLRVAVVLPVASLWGLVFVALRRGGYTRVASGVSVALIVGTPMYAFLGSSVNPDAVAIPLAVCLAVLCWRGLATGPSLVAIALVSMAMLFIKPSGIQAVLAIVGASAAYAWRRREATGDALEIARTLGASLLVAWALYYAWSPPSLSDGAGLSLSVWQYIAALPSRVPDLWVMFWGKLGWVDYQAPTPFYALLGLTSMVCAVWAAARARDCADVVFLGVFVALLVATTVAGELANVHRTGYMLQGRYFLPALVCVVPVVARAPYLVSAALGASVLALHLALFWLTFVRYWHADAGAFMASLPF
jgi:hypothetical protein